jgi:cold shock protein
MASNGTINRIVSDRGFGFIRGEDEKEYFFHRSSVEGLDFDRLAPGEQVTFDVQASDRGPRAVRVRAAS